MPAEPLISLILVVKNGMPCLPHAVASVVAQTYRNFEVVVQDGASTDGSLEFLSCVRGLPEIHIESQPDSGIGQAYNRALRRCRSEIIGSIDADNLLESDALAIIASRFAERPGTAAIYGAVRMIDAQGAHVSTWVPPAFDWLGLIRCDVVPPFGQSFYSRAVCGDALQFDESLKTCADFDLWLHLSHLPILQISEFIGRVRMSEKSMTCRTETYDQFCADKLTALRRYLDRQPRPPMADALFHLGAAGIYSWAAESIQRLKGHTPQFVRYVELALEHDPSARGFRRLLPLPPVPPATVFPPPASGEHAVASSSDPTPTQLITSEDDPTKTLPNAPMELAKCNQPYFELQIQYDNQVRCCCYYVGQTDSWDRNSEFNLSAYWNGPTMRTMRAIIASNRPANTGCAPCQFLRYVTVPSFLTPPDCLDTRQRSNWERALAHFDKKDLVLESTPVKYYLNFGLACNLRCVMCSQQDERRTDRRELSVAPLLALKEHLVVANELALIGGEPLVLPSARRFVDAVLADPAYANVQLSLFSNGTLLHQFLDRLQAMRRVNIIISLDSVDTAYEHIRRGAAWEQTSKNILTFRELGAKKNLRWAVNISGVVMKSSIPRLADFVDWCADHEIPVHFVPVSQQSFTQDEDVFHYPALLKGIPGWEKIFDRAIARLTAKGWTNAGAGPLSLMKAQLLHASTPVSRPTVSVPAVPAPVNPTPAPAAPVDYTTLRMRLGRMLGRPAMISDNELNAATLMLTEILEARDPAQCIAQCRASLPAATRALLLTHLASAWANKDTRLAAALEECHRALARARAQTAVA